MVGISTVFDCEVVSAVVAASVEALEALVLLVESVATPSRF